MQDFIERRLEAVFKRKMRIHGSGRTDAGVHADAQVFISTHVGAIQPARFWLLCAAGIPNRCKF